MLRFVQVYDKSANSLTVTADQSHRLKSRGIWISANRDVLLNTYKKNGFSGILKRKIQLPSSFELFMEEIHNDLKMSIMTNFDKSISYHELLKSNEANPSATIFEPDATITTSSFHSCLIEMIRTGWFPSEQLIRTVIPLFISVEQLRPSSANTFPLIFHLHQWHLLNKPIP